MFNLKKYAQTNPSGGAESLEDGLGEVVDSLTTEINQPPLGPTGIPEDESSVSSIDDNFKPEQMFQAQMLASGSLAQKLLAEIKQNPNGQEIINHLMANSDSWRRIQDQSNNPARDNAIAKDQRIQGLSQRLLNTQEFHNLERQIRNEVTESSKLFDQQRDQQTQRRNINQQMINAFNLKKYKTSQVMPLTNNENENAFIEKYAPILMSFKGDKGQNDVNSENAREEILKRVSPAAHEEVNDALRSVQQLNPNTGYERAAKILKSIFNDWVSSFNSTNPMETRMSEKTKGIIKHNLPLHVINNAENLSKTAANHFGDPFILYGPTEKRICPKLRGKNMGDVVSEYICRNHCLDGIVIDDNKTICGEALWRANVMDKQSREYVDEDGNITGGYIEKRFDVHHDVPEENKMRLKPGELRKPRLADQGSLESRMQAMRAAEGEKRKYRPETDTTRPFNWTKDVDQNNVEVPQKEKDRRETDSGHETVEYTNKDEQENKPKISFNLKRYKTANSKNYKTSQIFDNGEVDRIDAKPMTGPRGPVGSDNPQSDDLGLSPDMMDDIDDNYIEQEQSPFAEEIAFSFEGQPPNVIVETLNNIQKQPESAAQLTPGDWDFILTEVNNEISNLGDGTYIEKDFNTNQFTIKNLNDIGKPMLAPPIQMAVATVNNDAKIAAVENDKIIKTKNKTFPKDTGCSTCNRDSKEKTSKSSFNFSKYKQSASGLVVTNPTYLQMDEINSPSALSWFMKNKSQPNHNENDELKKKE